MATRKSKLFISVKPVKGNDQMFILETEYDTYRVRSYTDVDPDDSGTEVYDSAGKRLMYTLSGISFDVDDKDSMENLAQEIEMAVTE